MRTESPKPRRGGAERDKSGVIALPERRGTIRYVQSPRPRRRAQVNRDRSAMLKGMSFHRVTP